MSIPLPKCIASGQEQTTVFCFCFLSVHSCIPWPARHCTPPLARARKGRVWQVRDGFDLGSDPIAVLVFGEKIEVREYRTVDNGKGQVRFEKGWVCLHSPSGEELLRPISLEHADQPSTDVADSADAQHRADDQSRTHAQTSAEDEQVSAVLPVFADLHAANDNADDLLASIRALDREHSSYGDHAPEETLSESIRSVDDTQPKNTGGKEGGDNEGPGDGKSANVADTGGEKEETEAGNDRVDDDATPKQDQDAGDEVLAPDLQKDANRLDEAERATRARIEESERQKLAGSCGHSSIAVITQYKTTQVFVYGGGKALVLHIGVRLYFN